MRNRKKIESNREPAQFLMNRRGQLTIFIIIGIVLLFSAALITFIRQSVVLYKPPVEVAETVATELQPIQKYVTECLEIVAKEGIRKAGMQGGYIDTSKFIVNEREYRCLPEAQSRFLIGIT